MTKPLVFITGATGHIGFVTLALVLKKGYRVRVASRNLATAEKLKDLPSVKPYADSISFVEVPDFLAENAFDVALRDVDYVLHIASPLPDDTLTGTDFDVQKTYIDPAVQGNVGLLKAANKSPSVKRVVITSSVVILQAKPGATTVGPDDLAPVPKVEEIPQNPWAAYPASKVLANAAAVDFVSKENPHFDVVHVLPAYVQGRNEPVTSARDLVERPSSNQTMLNVVLGVKETRPRPSDLVLVDDVAAVHVAALENQTVTNGERFIAAYPRPFKWADLGGIVKKLFPEEVASGVLPLGDAPLDWVMGADASKTTERLGVEFHGHEDMVRSLIGQYVELVKKERA